MATDRRISRSAISLAVAQALGAAAGIGLAGPALAQEAQPELAPVMVTAQRREQDILDVPYNISAVSGDEIALRQTLDTPELLRGCLQALERAREPDASPAVRAPRGDVASLELDRSLRGKVEAGKHVHERRLPRAVRPDQPHHLVAMQLDRDTPKRVDTLERS